VPQRRFLDRLRRRGLRRRAGRGTLDVAPSLPERDESRLRAIVVDLLPLHDTMTQRAEAAAVADAYTTLHDDGKRRFLSMLAREFWVDPNVVNAAIDARHATAFSDEDAKRRADRALRESLTPSAAQLLHLFAGLDGGVKFLVDLRADLLRVSDAETDLTGGDPLLADLDRELKAQLATLFDVGLLTLRRIGWDAPASLLEKLISYEAVHAIDSWDDLKNRLDSDRRCYAFFHPAMPAELLVFVEIALTSGVATELTQLLDERAPDLDADTADTAVFYSISNCQPGLAGVNLGTALIKEVVEELRHDLPNLKRFATLSPIPGFVDWLSSELRDGGDLSARERELLPAEPERVLARLANEGWDADEAIRPAVLALCARFLTTTVDGRALDPVANFHLANGAAIGRINWRADPSPNGRARSAGIMANYLYEADRMPERAQAYVAHGEIAASSAVRDLLAE
jgi:malonyl-CoA decarboxylase